MKRRWPYGPLALAVLFVALPCAIACKHKKEPDPVAAAAAPVAASAAAVPEKAAGGALRIAYSDWPGWTAFEIAIQKGWFKEEGVEVQFEWFEYTPSMEAFAAGKVDAVTNDDGERARDRCSRCAQRAILITDYSNGNDMSWPSGHQGPQRAQRQKIGSRWVSSNICCCSKGSRKWA